MKKYTTLKLILASFLAVALATSTLVLPTSAAMDSGSSNLTSTSVTGVVRALMATEGNKDESPFQGMVLDTGRTEFQIDSAESENLTPGESSTISREDLTATSLVKSARLVEASQVYAPIPDRRLVIVPVQWEGSPFSATRATTLNSTSVALKNWWSKVSGGVESLTINTMPVQDIPVDTTCDYMAFRNAALSAVVQARLETWYTNVSIVLPEKSACWWGGLGYMPGQITWINEISVRVLAHEIGHNMGLAHANSCLGTSTVSFIQTCDHYEYGDVTDVMGNADGDFGFSAAYLKQVGWMGDSQVQTWTGGTQNIVLSTLMNTSGATRAVRIPMATTFGDTGPGEYWLQLNHEGKNSYPANGVYMNLVPTVSHLTSVSTKAGSTGQGIFTWLCDVTPSKTVDWNFSFVPGQQWNDPSGRFSILVQSVTASSASIRITPSAVAPIGVQTITTSNDVDSSGIATGGIKVDWTATAPIGSNLTEPLQWVATSSDGKSCSVAVNLRSCVITDVSRQKNLTVTIIGKNYAGTSVSKSAIAAPVPASAPFASISVSPLDYSAQLGINILSDGGSALTSVSLSLNGVQCALVNLMCGVSDLAPNTEYSVVATLQNTVGTRSVQTTVRTLKARPRTPQITFVQVDDHLQMRASVDPTDVNNVSGMQVYCPDVHQKWTSVPEWKNGVNVDLPRIPKSLQQERPKSFVSSSTSMSCSVASSNELGLIWKTEMSPIVTLYADGRITIGSPSEDRPGPQPDFKREVKISVRRIAAGTYKLSWKLSGSFAKGSKTNVVAPRVNGRSCVRASATSCVYRNLVLKKSQRIVVRVNKKGAESTFRGTRSLTLKK